MTTTTISPYAPPRHVSSLAECYFYHTMDVPGYGVQAGQWDLRAGVADYLGRVDLRGRRVLEIGTASGFLCFTMEAQGAQVVAVDLDEHQSWDHVPHTRYYGQVDTASGFRAHVHRLNNAWWLAHRAFHSTAQVVYSRADALPASIGAVDVTLFASVLLHIRDPFLALERAAALTRETMIVTDKVVPPLPVRRWRRWLGLVPPPVQDAMRPAEPVRRRPGPR